MNHQTMNHYKKHLQQEKEQLLQAIKKFEEWGARETMDEAAMELSAYDQHPADYGSQMFEREQDIGLLENLENQLGKVNDALKSIEKGNYGICKQCGKEIDEKRLNALPYTNYCVSCKRDSENMEGQDPSARPVEEDVLKNPFGRTFLDDTENVGFDGEDSWQAVARFGTANSPQDIGDVVEYGETYIDAEENKVIGRKIKGNQEINKEKTEE